MWELHLNLRYQFMVALTVHRCYFFTTQSLSSLKHRKRETRNERFLPEFPSSLLSGYALNTQTGHGRERDLVRGQFSLYREWYGRLMYNTYPIPTETPRLNVLS